MIDWEKQIELDGMDTWFYCQNLPPKADLEFETGTHICEGGIITTFPSGKKAVWNYKYNNWYYVE